MNSETQRVFEKLLLEQKLVTPDQLVEVERLQTAARGGAPGAGSPGGGSPDGEEAKSILDLLLEKGYGDPAKLQEAARLAAVRTGAERVTIGGFELLEKVGQGAMGAVYRASQVKIGRFVALKLMKPTLAKDPRYLERFLRETRASAKLGHPNIVQGIDAGQDKGYYYFAMEFVDGETLKKAIQREGRLPEKRCIEIGMRMAKALDHAFRFGLVHRDIKPENILIERDTGTPKLADLGLAKSVDKTDASVTQVGMALGTPNYISPEQARGEESIDTRSDLYSLGATLYHASTGTVPFDGPTAPVILSKHMTEPLEPPRQRNPELSLGFSQVIQKMMLKERDQRYQTPAELLEDLHRVARGEEPAAAATLASATAAAAAELARRVHREPSTGPAPARKGMLMITGAVLLIALGVGAVICFWPETTDGESRKTTEARGYFREAATVIETRPSDFEDIRDRLKKCIEADPQGPNAEPARKLLTTAAEFERLTKQAPRKPAEWAGFSASLKDLAAKAPKDPPYDRGIRNAVRTMALKVLADATGAADSDPTQAPAAEAWLNAVAQAESDPGLASDIAQRRAKLNHILNSSADFLLEKYGQDATHAAAQKRYKDAIDLLEDKMPKALVTPQLRALMDKRIGDLRQAAAAAVAEARDKAWTALNEANVDAARVALAEARAGSGLPELTPQLDAIEKTLQLAPTFLPSLAELAQAEAAEPPDEKAVAQAAMRMQREFGTDPYVASRLKKHEALIARHMDLQQRSQVLMGIQKLIDAEQYDEADAAIAQILADARVSAEQREGGAALRLKISPERRLAMLLAAGLKQQLPMDNVMLPMKDRIAPSSCKITALTKDGFAAESKGVRIEVAWNALGLGPVRELAQKRHLVKEDDPEGLYCLSTVLLADDRKETRMESRQEGKRLLQAARTKAEELAAKGVPVRALIAAIETQQGKIADAEAEAALRVLADQVGAVRATDDVTRAVAAYNAFKARYGETQYAKANPAAVEKVGGLLAEAIFRDRLVPVLPRMRDGNWKEIIPLIQKALDDTEKIVATSPKTRAAAESVMQFGKSYLVEDTIFRKVFSSHPWQLDQLARLKKDPNEEVAARARLYDSITPFKVKRQSSALEQLAYATSDPPANPVKDSSRPPVKDVYERLARYNGVFLYWGLDEKECEQAELAVAKEFRSMQGGGEFMWLLFLENFVRTRRGAPNAIRAGMELERLQFYARTADKSVLFRLFVVQAAKDAMSEYRGVGESPVWFCLMVADQDLALGNLDEAEAWYEKLINSKHKNHLWRGFLGRGAVRERRERYGAALEDYETAFTRTSSWEEGRVCAARITNLCLHSGKFDARAANGRRIVLDLMKRATGDGQIAETKKLLDKKPPP